MKLLTVFVLLLFSIVAAGQTFEGKIVYQNTYRNKKSHLINSLLGSMLGTRQEYYIKGGNYKSVTNGSMVQWQLYINSENKLYNKFASQEALYWNDGLENGDSVTGATLHKNEIGLLGYPCDELILHCKGGDQRYYFNPALAVNPELYRAHRFGNWYDVLSRTRALPLKLIVVTDSFITESIATEIVPMKLPDEFFRLPEHLPVRKNSF